jgi:hypothetical protein
MEVPYIIISLLVVVIDFNYVPGYVLKCLIRVSVGVIYEL